MKKINLKSILKKTFKKKKKVKKVKTKNKKNPKKIIKKVGRPKILKNEISNKKDIIISIFLFQIDKICILMTYPR